MIRLSRGVDVLMANETWSLADFTPQLRSCVKSCDAPIFILSILDWLVLPS
jgi:hypothetical protein